MRRLLLASGSARRKELLAFLGIPFEIVVSNFPEEDVRFDDCKSPGNFVSTIAVGKALAVAAQHPDSIIIGADTDVFLDGRVFGKPRDYEDARRILKELRAKTHEVWTGICVMDTIDFTQYVQAVRTQVEFLPFSDNQLDQYIKTGESLGKAGAYAIQHGAKGFVRDIHGSLSNVVGLPLEETAALLQKIGVPIQVDVSAITKRHFTFST